MSENIKPGEIVHCRFPTDEGGTLPHYGLVLSVRHYISGKACVRVAYGSSKKVDVSCRARGEIVISDPGQMAMAGLKKPTRFDMRRSANIVPSDMRRVGKLDASKKSVRRATEQALWEADYR